MNDPTPEIGQTVCAAGFKTNYHDRGDGPVIVLLHGSGPGVSAWANWAGIIPTLAERFRVIAPDALGFGHTQRPEDETYDLSRWTEHLIAFLRALDLKNVTLVGNSFGSALAMAIALEAPELVGRLALMGAVGLDFELSEGLDTAWGYRPSLANMRALLELFAFDRSRVSDSLVEMRHAASIRPGVQESFSRMFPAPRQAGIAMLAQTDEAIRSIKQRTIIIHGRHDKIIPVENAHKLHDLIPQSDLHILSQCGHWVQIERSRDFLSILNSFAS